MRRVIQESNDITARMTEQTQSAATQRQPAASARLLRLSAIGPACCSPSLCLAGGTAVCPGLVARARCLLS